MLFYSVKIIKKIILLSLQNWFLKLTNFLESYSKDQQKAAAHVVTHILRHIDRYLKNGVWKSIAHLIKHGNF